MQARLQKAVEVPLRAMRVEDTCWDAMLEMAAHGNIASRSDLEVGAKALETGILGAWRNVVINVDQIKDEPFRRRMSAEGDEIRQRAAQRLQDVLGVLGRR